ncbi:MAG: hypothetical protein ACJ79K_16015 [Gemmatimonadaceae bacterium]
MNADQHRLWPRLAAYAGLSVLLWAGAVGALWWYLQRMVAEDYRTGARTSTGGDSIAVPLFSVAILVAGILIVANAVVAAVLLWRRRARSRSASLPAV